MNPLAEMFASSVDFSDTSPIAHSHHASVANDNSGNDQAMKQSLAPKAGHRVCDRCIVKKVKCDMKEPSCSRCLEANSTCNYSVKKRKPGPVKGSKHARRKMTTKDNTVSHQSSHSASSSPGSHRGSDASVQQFSPWKFEQPQTEGMALGPPMVTILEKQTPDFFRQHLGSPVASSNIPSPLGIPPSQDVQRMLLEKFFLHIHPSIPLFHQEGFFARYETGSLSQHLLLTMCAVTAKILGQTHNWDGSSLDDCMLYLFKLKVVEDESAGKVLSLDNFRQACLLAFFAFHQYPGEKAWMRVGNLTRKAYQCGLHQIDNNTTGSTFDHEKVSLSDREEWRYVWWCIYCLDCYTNVTATTPFIVEVESIKTALVSHALTGSIEDLAKTPSLSYLPHDTDILWKTAKSVTTSAGAINFNMHILTTTLIREAATILRLRRQSTSKKLKTRMSDLEDHFSAFRLALPMRYLNASRNAFVDESSSEHHARLICVLHIHLARLLTYFPSDPQANMDDWSTRWQQTLECCQDVVGIIKQWDSQYFPATDPAICFIISSALTLVHLHGSMENVQLEFKVRMETYQDVLVLFLEQFASAWSLPRFLILSFEQIKRIVTGPLTPLDVERVLKVCTGPMNYRWLNFLSLSEDFQSLDSPGRMYGNMFSQEFDLNDWEVLMPPS